jgi:hypothetical protein
MIYGDSGDDSDVELHVFDSSNVASASFNKKTGEATVVFARDGRTYSTDHMTPELWDAFKDAPSAGRFYNANLKDLFS